MKGRNLLLALATACASYILVELCALALYYGIYGTPFSFSYLSVLQKGARVATRTQGDVSQPSLSLNAFMTPHPYMAFVYNPDLYSGDPLMTPYGFRGEADPIIASRDHHNAIVAITGGSVSEQMFIASRPALHEALEKIPVFRGRKLVLVMLGREAYQQPQQLISVAYYLMQGGRLDMLINLDGYNEVRHGLINHSRGIYPAYPSSDSWRPLFTYAPLPDRFDAIGRMMLWKQARYLAVSTFSHLRFSITASTLWRLIDTYLYQQLVQAQLALSENTNFRSYALDGPPVMNTATDRETAEFIASIWKKSSLFLYQLAKANHFYYFHFLQPNQHVPDSKPLSQEEKNAYYAPQSSWAKAVVLGYPFLQKNLNALRADGIAAYDLAYIFKDTVQTTYIDSCCHLNQTGNDMLARSIGAHIREFFDKPEGTAGKP